jgi:putative oxidoreductase
MLRIVTGLLFLEHGTQKLLGFPPGEHAGVAVMSLPWIAGLLELVLGTLIVLGLFTRPAAFVASGEMAVAYWLAHAPQGFFPSTMAATRRSFIALFSCIWWRQGQEP